MNTPPLPKPSSNAKTRLWWGLHQDTPRGSISQHWAALRSVDNPSRAITELTGTIEGWTAQRLTPPEGP